MDIFLEILNQFNHFIGHGVCHQLPSRTFETHGYLFPVCSRDTGTHLGLITSFLTLIILHRKAHPRLLPPVNYLLALGLFVIPLAFDGLTSYTGIRETTNLIRFMTGLCMGMGLGALIYAVIASLIVQPHNSQNAFLFQGKKHFIPWLIITPVIGASVGHLITRMGIVGATIGSITLIGSFTLVILALILALKPDKKDQSNTYGVKRKELIRHSIVSILVTLLFLSLIAIGREFVVSLMFGRF